MSPSTAWGKKEQVALLPKKTQPERGQDLEFGLALVAADLLHFTETNHGDKRCH